MTSNIKRIVLLVASAALASCAKDGSSTPTEAEYGDVASAIGSTTSTGSGGGEVGSFADSAALATGQTPSGLTLSASGHASGEHLGIDYDYKITCSSAAGQAQTACDHSTDRAEVKLSWSGSLDVPGLSASVDRSGDWTLSAIQSGTPTFNGEGTFTFDIAVQSSNQTVSASYHLDYDATYNAVVLSSAHRPVGGSIHYAISAEHTVMGVRGSGDGTFSIDAVVTFAADGSATLTLDGSRHFRLDLATGATTRM